MRELISEGNELVALAAIDCGCKFFGGYPITPSSEIAHNMSVLLPKNDGVFIQMEDEIAGISVAIGGSMGGARSLTATSGPGMSLKAEQIGYAFIAEIPLVIVDVMRGGPSTGLPTRVSQGDINFSKNPTHGDYQSITLCPGDLSETYTETVRAFNLAEELMTPVILLLDETLGHMHGKAVIPEAEEVKKGIVPRKKFDGDPKDYKPYDVPNNEPAVLNPFFTGYKYHLTGLTHGYTGFPTEDEKLSSELIARLFNKIQSRTSSIDKYEEYLCDDAEILIIAYGSASLSVKEAINEMRRDGIKVGLFRPITIWPSPSKKLAELGKKFSKILVVELNLGQYRAEIERIMKKEVKFYGKANGRAISPSEIINEVRGL